MGTPPPPISPRALHLADVASAAFTPALHLPPRTKVAAGRLEGRPGQKQFEIFSADYMLDTHGAIDFGAFYRVLCGR